MKAAIFLIDSVTNERKPIATLVYENTAHAIKYVQELQEEYCIARENVETKNIWVKVKGEKVKAFAMSSFVDFYHLMILGKKFSAKTNVPTIQL